MTRTGWRRRMASAAVLLTAVGTGACMDRGPVSEPELLTTTSPFRYPVALWDARTEGETILMIRVTETGAVDTAYVLHTSGHPAFDSAALAGVRDLEFIAGRRGDRRVATWARLPVRFNIDDPTGPRPGGSNP